jgi:hypothetical protein
MLVSQRWRGHFFQNARQICTRLLCLSWRWRHYVSPNRRYICQATRSHIPKAGTPRSHRCENLKHGTNCSTVSCGGDLGSRNIQFESRPGHRLPWPKSFVVFASPFRPVLTNVFIYWGASDWWLWRRGRRVAIAIIIIIIIIIVILIKIITDENNPD